ncbi:MAG: hypothetical protein BMS9Abin18_1394 [Zetaproteobacteria bacterium]|nr:MAG: hypothetical protein BMS9Abin18_1394 [Zetaproteobacteria bacterium]
MQKIVSFLLTRLRNRPDSEHEQAIIRVGIVGLFCLFFYIQEPFSVFFLALIYLLFAIILFIWILIFPGKSVPRRILGIIGDIGVTSAGMILPGNEDGAPLVAVYLWVVTGNGFRYGLNYLLFSTIIAGMGFLSVIAINPYWTEHIVLSISLLFVTVVIPMYMAGLIRKLRHAISIAEEANRIKSQFIANMSHELRTPLSGIIGMSDLLASTNLNQEQNRFATVIKDSGHHLLSLIERILDMSRIEAGKLEIAHEPFDLHQLVHGCVAIFEAQAKEKGIRVEARIDADVPFNLLGDPKHLREIFINLAGNAVKFTNTGSVRINVSLLDKSDAHVQLKFTITDTGIGMSEEAQSRIFERFTQADDSVTRRFGGTGLGTTISKELIELMGGSISLRSKEEEGTTFTVTLPFERQPEINKARDLAGMRVLLLAGSTLLDKLTALLNRWGATCDSTEDEKMLFSSVVDALASGQAYDVLIVEQAKLELKPERIANAIRNKNELSDLDTILIDPGINRGNDQKMLVAGFTSVLHMPLEESLLFNALHVASVVHAHAEVIPIADVYRRKQGVNAMNILLAEDNPVNQEVIGEILRRAGHQVQIAEDGEKALDALASDKEFDMVLLDMNMPEVSGLDVLKQFRFMDTSAKTPVVMLSADALPETIRACKEAGANDYLTKPVNLEELLETLAMFAQAQEDRSGEEQHPPVSFEDINGVIDTRQLDEFAWMSESSKKIEKFISLYESSGHEHLSAMDTAAAEGDKTKFLNEEHAFKGAAATMGAIKVAALCREIENHKASLCQRDMLSYREKLQSAFQQSLNGLHTYLKTLDAPKT